MSYRSAVHETTKFTPAMLMFGRELRVPLHLLIGRPQEEPGERGYPEYVESERVCGNCSEFCSCTLAGK